MALKYASADGVFWRKQQEIADELGMSRQTVHTVFKDAGTSGLVVQDHYLRPVRRGQGASTYRFDPRLVASGVNEVDSQGVNDDDSVNDGDTRQGVNEDDSLMNASLNEGMHAANAHTQEEPGLPDAIRRLGLTGGGSARALEAYREDSERAVALAQKALARATTNPAGLFLKMLNDGEQHYATPLPLSKDARARTWLHSDMAKQHARENLADVLEANFKLTRDEAVALLAEKGLPDAA
jgi:hypothetical protein